MTDQNTVATVDPMDAAMDAEYTPRTQVYFGLCGVDTWYAALIKGAGKVNFDANQHRQDQRVTAIKIAIDAFKREGGTFVLEREMIAESKEWAQVVKPSLRAINADLRGLAGKYVRVEIVPFGGTYVSKRDNVERAKTTIKFLEVFASEHECREAMSLYFTSYVPESQPAPTPPPTPNNTERATAQKFLQPLWNSCANDLLKFEALLKKTIPVNKYFTVNSPEVQEIISKAMVS